MWKGKYLLSREGVSCSNRQLKLLTHRSSVGKSKKISYASLVFGYLANKRSYNYYIFDAIVFAFY